MVQSITFTFSEFLNLFALAMSHNPPLSQFGSFFNPVAPPGMKTHSAHEKVTVLEKELEKVNSTSKEWKQKYEASQERIGELFIAGQKEADKLKTKMRNETSQKMELMTRLTEMGSEIKQLKNVVLLKESKIDELQKQLADGEKLKKEMKTEFSNEKATLQLTIKELEDKVAAEGHQILDLQKDVDAEIELRKKTHQEHAQEKMSLLMKISELEAKMAHEEIQRAQVEVEKNKEKERLHEEVSKTEKLKKKVADGLQLKNEIITEFARERKTLQLEIEEWQAKWATEANEYSELQKKVDGWQKDQTLNKPTFSSSLLRYCSTRKEWERCGCFVCVQAPNVCESCLGFVSDFVEEICDKIRQKMKEFDLKVLEQEYNANVIEDLKQEVEQQKKEIDVWRKGTNDAQMEILKFSDENLQKVQKGKLDWMEKFYNAQNEFTSQKTKYSVLQHTLTEKIMEISRLSNELQELKESYELLDKSRLEQNKKLRNLAKDLGNQKDNIEDLQKKNQKLENQNEELKKKRDDLYNEVRGVHRQDAEFPLELDACSHRSPSVGKKESRRTTKFESPLSPRESCPSGSPTSSLPMFGKRSLSRQGSGNKDKRRKL
ncbi:hypothetical protein GCK72_022607 [Caenorhabditis remanei]|uniref:Uncharacterized protein n=1 Tax=Caenorhabditis remanei TaxID=31234 RepID=A0A6A5FUE2_CAERE|nr:hypothetical protein GCK72_022607 [Caenorhabditis remanei]KAF1746154.1 hypothetical protein GCK72_022607 [Caenorhabditis remanei]